MDAVELRAFITERYNDDELRALTFDIGIPFEDLGAPDSGKTARVQALIEWCNRHGRYAELETTTRRARTAAPAERHAPAMNDWGPAGVDRMVRNMDELRGDVAELMTKVEVLTQRLAMMEKHIDRIIDHPTPVTWQTWAVAIIGLLTAVALIYTVGQLLLGGH